ncbi:MAG TPA: AIR synthase-related protein [Candidatus Limnocylindrales bacterium]|nr:AIR synthase-related protein [Candidatus Limnocylindrales bacterium]
MGKLPNKELKQLLSCIKKDSRVIIPPMVGYDSGVHVIDGKYLVVASDPCTGVPEEWFGYLLINNAASDVALSGAKPEFCTINLLGPRSTKPEVFQKIMKQTCLAADELDIAIVRGHTGMYDSLGDLVGVATVYGTVHLEKLITPGNAKPGDLIFSTKPLGLEIVINFSLTQKKLAEELFGSEQQEKLSTQVRMQSCVREAQQLAETGIVHAMHDATEGGFVAALNELAEASGVGFRVDWEKIPLSKEVRALQNYFNLTDEQVLAMSSTGTVLAAVDPHAQEKVNEALMRSGLTAYFMGEFTEDKACVMVKQGKEMSFPAVSDDPYGLIVSGG